MPIRTPAPTPATRTRTKPEVMADVGCRNTVFDGRTQTAARHLVGWREVGVADFRLEFVHEDAAGVREVVTAFRAFRAGSLSVTGLERRLAAASAPTLLRARA